MFPFILKSGYTHIIGFYIILSNTTNYKNLTLSAQACYTILLLSRSQKEFAREGECT